MTRLSFIALLLGTAIFAEVSSRRVAQNSKKLLQEVAGEVHTTHDQDLLEALQKASEAHQFMSRKAASKFNGSYPGEFFASCSQRQEDFERRARKTKQRLDMAKADGQLDVTEYGWVLLKAHSMIQTYVTAAEEECQWVLGGDKEDASGAGAAAAALFEDTKDDIPCLAHGVAYLEENKEKENALMDFMAILMSKDCKLPARTDVHLEGEEDLNKAIELEHQEEAKAMESAKSFKEAAKKLKSGSAASLFQSNVAFHRSLKLHSGMHAGDVLRSGSWQHCANEGEICHCSNATQCQVRYWSGDDSTFSFRNINGSTNITCSATIFGDPQISKEQDKTADAVDQSNADAKAVSAKYCSIEVCQYCELLNFIGVISSFQMILVGASHGQSAVAMVLGAFMTNPLVGMVMITVPLLIIPLATIIMCSFSGVFGWLGELISGGDWTPDYDAMYNTCLSTFSMGFFGGLLMAGR